MYCTDVTVDDLSDLFLRYSTGVFRAAPGQPSQVYATKGLKFPTENF